MVTVLLVDDDAAALILFDRMLRRGGFQALLAEDADQVFSILEIEHPDVIVLDIMMPGIDGIELCRRLRGREDTQDTPILMLSAKGDTYHYTQAMDAGATDYLHKPILATDLVSKVREMVVPHDDHIEDLEVRSSSAVPQTSESESMHSLSLSVLIEHLNDRELPKRGEAVIELARRAKDAKAVLNETAAQRVFWHDVRHSVDGLPLEEAKQRWGRMAEVAWALTQPQGVQNDRLRLLAGPNRPPEVRATALRALGLNRVVSVADILAQAAAEPDKNIRLAAVEALGWLGKEKGIPVAQRAIHDPSMMVRHAAINTLAKIGNDAAVEILRQTLHSEDCTVRIDVIKALAREGTKIAAKTATAMLIEAIHGEQDTDVISAIAMSLAEIGDRTTLPVLTTLAGHADSDVREHAQEAITAIKKRLAAG